MMGTQGELHARIFTNRNPENTPGNLLKTQTRRQLRRKGGARAPISEKEDKKGARGEGHLGGEIGGTRSHFGRPDPPLSKGGDGTKETQSKHGGPQFSTGGTPPKAGHRCRIYRTERGGQSGREVELRRKYVRRIRRRYEKLTKRGSNAESMTSGVGN